MRKTRIADEVDKGRVLVSDGAWGTFLYSKGLTPRQCPELWCVERPEDVLDIAKSYVAAGADMIETDSFGGNGIRLAYYGLRAMAPKLNEAAARISRTAAGEKAWVIASIGPSGKMLARGDVTEAELYEAFAEQAIALEKGGADALCVETMSDAVEACLAVRAAKAHTKLEVLCTFTFDKTARGDYRTMIGLSPDDAAKAALEAGADAIGTNCGNGTARMVDIVRAMRTVDARVPDTRAAQRGPAGQRRREGRLSRGAGRDGLVRARSHRGRRQCHRRLLRHDPRAHRGDQEGGRFLFGLTFLEEGARGGETFFQKVAPTLDFYFFPVLGVGSRYIRASFLPSTPRQGLREFLSHALYAAHAS